MRQKYVLKIDRLSMRISNDQNIFMADEIDS